VGGDVARPALQPRGQRVRTEDLCGSGLCGTGGGRGSGGRCSRRRGIQWARCVRQRATRGCHAHRMHGGGCRTQHGVRWSVCLLFVGCSLLLLRSKAVAAGDARAVKEGRAYGAHKDEGHRVNELCVNPRARATVDASPRCPALLCSCSLVGRKQEGACRRNSLSLGACPAASKRGVRLAVAAMVG
jgi:hypothetical protein